MIARSLLAAALLLAPVAPALSQDDADMAPLELPQVGWQGMTVKPVVRKSGGELRFYAGRKLVRTEREEEAQRWFVAPPQDLDGDGKAELIAWYWSGGAHCCVTYAVYSGAGAARFENWRLYQGDGDALLFRKVEGYPRPVLKLPDTSTAYLSGSFADTPMLPFVVEIGPGGFSLAQALMRSAGPGLGPAVLREGPEPLAAFMRGGELEGLKPPEERLAEIRAKSAEALAEAEPQFGARDVLAASGVLALIEKHVMLYCVYDASCDIPRLVAEAEPKQGVLTEYAAELAERWQASQVRRLREGAP